jgi:hypothetical protein
MNAGGFCMSTGGDLLSQWRGYADQGRGVSVGFSAEYLGKLCEASRGNAKFGFSLQRVHYDVDTQDKNIAPTIDMIAERAENLPRYPKLGSILSSGEEEEHARKEHSSAIMSMTLPVLLLFANLYTSKNPAFREEQEWRLIAFIPTGGPNGEMLTDCDFRASGDRIVPFVSVSMLDHGVRPIDRIILGPKNQTPPKIVRALLAGHGFSGAIVEQSTASFR